jgi:hypothetical protein
MRRGGHWNEIAYRNGIHSIDRQRDSLPQWRSNSIVLGEKSLDAIRVARPHSRLQKQEQVIGQSISRLRFVVAVSSKRSVA